MMDLSRLAIGGSLVNWNVSEAPGLAFPRELQRILQPHRRRPHGTFHDQGPRTMERTQKVIYTSRRSCHKKDEVAGTGTICVFKHDPEIPASTVSRDATGKYLVTPVQV